MMIDIHTHYGEIEGGYHMPLEMQLEAMEAYGIDYALISNIECGIFHEGIEGNRKMLEMVRVHQDRLGCMLWRLPSTCATVRLQRRLWQAFRSGGTTLTC